MHPLRVLFIAATLGVAGAIGTFGWLAYEEQSRLTAATPAQALIGGPFQAVSHTGEPVDETALEGKHTLMFFGFTFCPDICPTSLSDMAAALDQLGPAADGLQTWFVSVDPERDTPEKLGEYVTFFHPDITGVTGTLAQMDAMARTFRVYYAKVDAPDVPGGYLIDHSSIILLMGPDGQYKAHFSHGTPVETMVRQLSGYLS